MNSGIRWLLAMALGSLLCGSNHGAQAEAEPQSTAAPLAPETTAAGEAASDTASAVETKTAASKSIEPGPSEEQAAEGASNETDEWLPWHSQA